MKKTPGIVLIVLTLFCVVQSLATSACQATFKTYSLHFDKSSDSRSCSQDMPVAESAETEDENDESGSHKLLAIQPYEIQNHAHNHLGLVYTGKYKLFSEPVSRFLSIRSLRI